MGNQQLYLRLWCLATGCLFRCAYNFGKQVGVFRKWLWLTLAFAGAAYPGNWKAVQAVQSEINYATSITLSVTPTINGSTLVLLQTNAGQSDRYASAVITDNQGNVWQRATTKSDTGSNASANIWYVSNAKGGVTQVQVVPQGGSSGCAFLFAGFEEWTPPPGKVTLDIVNGTITSVPPASEVSSSVTTTGNDLVIAGGALPNISDVAAPFSLDLFHVTSGSNQGEAMASATNPAAAHLSSKFAVGAANYQPNAVLVIASFGVGASGDGESGGDIALSGCNAGVNGGTTPVGTPCTIISSSPNTRFSLDGDGTLSCTNDCSSTVFTPPQSVSTPVRQGCPVTPSDSIFNTRVDSLPLNPNNAAWMANANFAAVKMIAVPSWGLNVVTNAVPTRTYNFRYTSTLDGQPFPIMPAALEQREGGSFSHDNPSDHHSVWLNRDSCNFLDLYEDGEFFLHQYSGTYDATSGALYSGLTYDLPSDPSGSTDAAGLPLGPLTLHASDIRFGLKHMTRMTLCTGCISAATHYWPAQQNNGSSCPISQCASNGSIFRLNKAWHDAHRSSNNYVQNILDGWEQYGIIVADNGISGQVQTDLDVFQDPGVIAALNYLADTPGQQIPFAAFEVVDQFDTANSQAGSLMVSSVSSQIAPANGYVTPPNHSLITAKKGPSVVSLPIAVQPVAIGTPYPLLFTQAGMTPYQLVWWVRGTSDQGVIWTHTSGPGSVTSEGLYTAPASIATVGTDTLTGTAAANPSAIIRVIITVYPQGQNPINTIRMDVGGPGCSISPSSGCDETWNPDVMPTTATVNYSGGVDDYPTPWAGNDFFVWESGHTAYNDVQYGPYILPNGHYDVTYMVGRPGTVGQTYDPNAIFDADLDRGPVILSANDSISGVEDLGLLTPQKYAERAPEVYTFPAKVSNNILIVRDNLWGYSGGSVSSPFLSGLVIKPDPTTAPSWTIDSNLQTSVTAGTLAYWNCMQDIDSTASQEPRVPGTIQLRVIDWFTGRNDPKWSILSGPGQIDSSSGCYTAPTGLSRPAPVTIQATDGTYTARLSLTAGQSN